MACTNGASAVAAALFLVTRPNWDLAGAMHRGCCAREAATRSAPTGHPASLVAAGLLACLALRYDASRSTDMRSRALAAADAINDALATLEPGASGRQIADAAAAAADQAYDRVADREAAQRDGLVNEHLGSSGHSTGEAGDSTAAVAASDAVLAQRAYFTPVAVAYVVGLLSAFAANSITHLGQPAVSALSLCAPACWVLTGNDCPSSEVTLDGTI